MVSGVAPAAAHSSLPFDGVLVIRRQQHIELDQGAGTAATMSRAAAVAGQLVAAHVKGIVGLECLDAWQGAAP
jgi:hypothetical protein